MTEAIAAKQYTDNEKLINEEYKIWKTTVPLLYDTIHSYALSSSSLTVSPFSELEVSSDGNDIQAKFLLGTHHRRDENHVALWSVLLPATLATDNFRTLVPTPSGPSIGAQFELSKKWNHDGDVLKALPVAGYNGFATLNSAGDVKLWNTDEDSSDSLHTSSAVSLRFSPSGDNLALGYANGNIQLWEDVKDSSQRKISTIYKYHDATVNDFSWNPSIPTLFASVSDDMSIGLVDTRVGNPSSLLQIREAHKDVIDSVEFNPKLESLLVTGSADNVINVWDLRQPMTPLRTLYGHNGAVTHLHFSPQEPQYLGSASSDRRVHIWDLSKIDEDFDADDYIKNDRDDPCLKFIHGGHTGKITDFNWLPGVYNTLVSVAEDGLVEVWKPHFNDEEEDDEEEEEEEAKVEVEVKEKEEAKQDAQEDNEENNEEAEDPQIDEDKMDEDEPEKE